MRTAFIQQLTHEARTNPSIFLVVGDLGFSVVEPFAQEFPKRFLNAGVAEQNMTGVAAGLASEGFHVFTYSIANFPTLRCLEQIRNDVCYHNLPVTVVAVGGGLAYGSLGYSHHAVQDFAIMRTLPNLTLLAPGDPGEARESVSWLSAHPGPSYLRIGKAGEKVLHDIRGIERGPLRVKDGRSGVALVAAGGILDETLAAASRMAEMGIEVAVYSMPWLKPITPSHLECLASYRAIIAVEEHVSEGGLASVLRENLPTPSFVSSLAVPENISGRVGSQSWLRREAGISAEHIVECGKRLLSSLGSYSV